MNLRPLHPNVRSQFELRDRPRLDVPWTITGKVVHDFEPHDGIPDVTIKALDPLSNQEIARTITKAKGDYSFELPAGSSNGYLIRPERFLYYFMPAYYRVYASMNVPNFQGHTSK